MKKVLILASLATILASSQVFAMMEEDYDILGTLKVDGTLKVASGRRIDLGAQGEIHNFGRLEGEGEITGRTGSRIVNSIDFREIVEGRREAAIAINEVRDATNYLEPFPAHIDEGLVETSDGLAVIHNRNIGVHEMGEPGKVFVLVDGIEDDKEYVLVGQDLSVEASLANKTDESFSGTPHGLTTIGTVVLKGDNSNFETGPFNIGNWYDETKVTVAKPEALPTTGITVTPKSVLEFSTEDASEFILRGDLVVKTDKEGGFGKLKVPAGQTLVIPDDISLELADREDAPDKSSVPSSDPMSRRTHAYEFETVNGDLAAFMGDSLERTFSFRASGTSYGLFISKRAEGEFFFRTDMPSFIGITLLAKQKKDNFTLCHDGYNCCKLETWKGIVRAFANKNL